MVGFQCVKKPEITTKPLLVHMEEVVVAQAPITRSATTIKTTDG